MADTQTTGNQTRDYQALNREALYATYNGLVHVRELASEILRLVDHQDDAVKRKLNAIEGIADSLHNIPQLVADQMSYEPELMRAEINRAIIYWGMGNE